MITLQTIRKRNGDVVDFDKTKIIRALEKAFKAVRGGSDPIILGNIVGRVVEILEERFVEQVPSVENVQNIVEKVLMEAELFDVAKDYIIYRYEHTKQREEKKKEVIEKLEKNDLMITKRSGALEKFDINKLKKAVSWAIKGFENIVDVDAITLQCRAELYENIKTKDIARSLIMSTRAWIEQDTAYSFVTARLLLNEIYKTVIGHDIIDFALLDQQYRQAFIKNIKQAVQIGRLDPRMLLFDLEALSLKLVPKRDELLMYLGVQTLADRYFIQNHDTKEILESPQAFWMRVAMGLALNEKDKLNQAVRFYDIMSSLRFIPSTPTLFHAGTPRPQLSSCYLNTVSDSLDNIFKTYADNAQLSKWSGGIGTDWTNVRGTGAYINGTGVESQGMIPFLKIANDTTVAINRSGRRRGAACVYCEIWHYDIEDFAELRKNTGDERRRTHDMDTAIWIPDLFMKRVREDGAWTLFSPDETPDLHHIYGKKFEERYAIYENKVQTGEIRLFKKIKARDLWKKIISMLFETGHPWITFKDPSNIRSPQDHVGVVHNSNLCTEITLNTSEDETAVCNLGSINMSQHIVNGNFDINLIRTTVTIAMRMLDNVIDVNYYPTVEAKNSNMRHRPVGLGIMGFQDALYELGVNFDSEECVRFADESMEAISYYAILASTELAHERGTYKTFPGSKWDRGLLPVDTIALLEQERGETIDVSRTAQMDWSIVREAIRQYGMRNSNCLAMAPTATISTIAGSVPTIEPIYKNIYVKANQTGDFTVVNSYLVEDLKKLRLWDYELLGKIKYHDGNISQISEIPQHLKDKYKEVFEIDPKWLIRAAAYRGKWIDQSQSLNIFFVGTSGKALSEVYQYAWEMGLKTTYYLRSLAASQVEKSTVDTAQFGSTHQRTDVSAKNTPMHINNKPTADVAPIVQEIDEANIIVELAVAPTLPIYTMNGIAINPDIKLCRIDEPDCEACQ